MIKRIYLSIVFLIALTGAALASTFPSPPTNDIYVADYASMLNDADKNQIIELGRELDQKHGAQIVVVTLDTLDGADIDQYANELFRAWGIGDGKNNSGVLLLIAKEDRKFRIEVGYGLEGAITDGYAGSILDGMKDQFRAENYSSAIVEAYARLTLKAYEEYGDTPSENLNNLANPNDELTWWETLLGGGLILSFLGSIVYGFYKLIKGLFGSFDEDNKERSTNDDDADSSSGSSGSSSSSSNDSFGGGSSGGGGASDGW